MALPSAAGKRSGGKAKAATEAREVVFDPRIASAVSQKLAQGLHPSLVTMQLSPMGEPDVINAYIQRAQSSPFFQGAMAGMKPAKKMDWIMDSQSKAWRLSPDATTIPRVDKPTPDDFLKQFYANQRPAILTGLVDDWPAMTRWNADYFDEKVGRDTEVEAQKGRDKVARFEQESIRLKSRVSLGEVTDHLRSGKPSNDLYITANNGSANRDALDPLWADFSGIAGLTDPTSDRDGFLWIGPKGTLTPFHHDLTNNLLIQVRGRKQVHMVPPWEERRMNGDGRVFSGLSLEDAKAAAEHGLPLIETVIGPGDALFIPVGWWHHIVSLDESYSVLFTNFVWPNNYASPYMKGESDY